MFVLVRHISILDLLVNNTQYVQYISKLYTYIHALHIIVIELVTLNWTNCLFLPFFPSTFMCFCVYLYSSFETKTLYTEHLIIAYDHHHYQCQILLCFFFSYLPFFLCPQWLLFSVINVFRLLLDQIYFVVLQDCCSSVWLLDFIAVCVYMYDISDLIDIYGFLYVC